MLFEQNVYSCCKTAQKPAIFQFQTDLDLMSKECTDSQKVPENQVPIHIDGLEPDETGFFVDGNLTSNLHSFVRKTFSLVCQSDL
jgi:hypothetical protein